MAADFLSKESARDRRHFSVLGRDTMPFMAEKLIAKRGTLRSQASDCRACLSIIF